jgi:protein SCO1/2
MNTARRLIPVIVVLIVLIVVAAVGYRAYQTDAAPTPVELMDAGIVMLPQGKALPALNFTTQDKEAITLDSLKGQWRLMFFGYTFCPDVCPATLAQLKQLFAKLPEQDRVRLGVTFVTVDPARDTPERLKQYVEFFNPGFKAINGSMTDTQTLANTVGIPFIPADTTQASYTVDHGANLVLIDPNGKAVGYVRQPMKLDLLAQQLPRLMNAKR